MEAIHSANPKRTILPGNNVHAKTAENTKVEKIEQRVDQTTTKNVIENGKVIVEQYDKHGKLVRKTPPGYLPPGEKN